MSNYYQTSFIMSQGIVSFFLNLQILLQHRKQKFHKKADRAEEEKQSNMRKELCNPGALASSKEMKLILFMWER